MHETEWLFTAPNPQDRREVAFNFNPPEPIAPPVQLEQADLITPDQVDPPKRPRQSPTTERGLQRWSSDEDALLRFMLVRNESFAKIAIDVGRSRRAVVERARSLGLQAKRRADAPSKQPLLSVVPPLIKSRGTHWPPEEHARLLTMIANGMSYMEISTALGRTYRSVETRAINHGARATKKSVAPPRMDKTNTFWSPENDAKILDLLATGLAHAAIAKSIGRTKRAVILRAQHLVPMAPHPSTQLITIVAEPIEVRIARINDSLRLNLFGGPVVDEKKVSTGV